MNSFLLKLKPYFGTVFLILFLIIYHGYLIAAGIINYQRAAPLIYVTVFLWICFFINWMTKNPVFQKYYRSWVEKLDEVVKQKRYVPIGIKLAIIAILIAYTVFASIEKPSRLSGFFGYTFFIIFMFVCSNNRMKINWNIVSNALIMHYCLAIIILRWPTGQWFFSKLANLIIGLLEYAQVGAKFVFGFLADPPNICDLRPVFIFTSLQTLIYFSAVVSLLFYFGIIQIVLTKASWFMKVLIGTTGAESVYAWACTFLGMTEAPLMIAPYIEKLTDAEIFAVLTTGFSCVGGTVFAAYVALGACPDYILTASILSAPMSLACAKMLFPEVEEPKLKDNDFELKHENKKGFFDTLCSAGVALVPTVFAIGATLVVVMSLLALLDTVVGYIGHLIGFDGWTFQMLFGYVFFPLAYMMGVNDDVNQTLLVAELMGSKTAVNEFVAYDRLGQLQKDGLLHPKSVLVATYALCGFSNFGSMGIQMEMIGNLAPSRKDVISKIMALALLGGSISCFMNASVAGILIDSPIVCKSPSSNSTCFRIP